MAAIDYKRNMLTYYYNNILLYKIINNMLFYEQK